MVVKKTPRTLFIFNINESLFNQNLALTQRYCAAQCEKREMSIAEIFRSFNPDMDGQPLFTFLDGRWDFEIERNLAPWMMAKWAFDPLEREPIYPLEKLFDDQLSFKEQNNSDLGNAEYPGNILVVEIDGIIIDGVSEHESLGFIDCYDMPPIDTWFYLAKTQEGRLLYCWIPASMRQHADAAVEVNCVGCIYWLTSP